MTKLRLLRTISWTVLIFLSMIGIAFAQSTQCWTWNGTSWVYNQACSGTGGTPWQIVTGKTFYVQNTLTMKGIDQQVIDFSLLPAGINRLGRSALLPAPTYQSTVALWASGACTGYLRHDGTCSISAGMIWPLGSGTAIPAYNGSGGWGTSYNAANPIPASFGGTGFNSSGSTGYPYVTGGTWSFRSAGQVATSMGLGTAAYINAGTNTNTYICRFLTGTGYVCDVDPSTIGGGASSLAYFLVTRATSAPANAINMGLLTTGLLYQTVSGSVATMSIKAIGTDVQAYSANLTSWAALAPGTMAAGNWCGTTGSIINCNTSSAALAAAILTTYTQITGLFGGGSCTGVLYSDGTCKTLTTDSFSTGYPGNVCKDAGGNIIKCTDAPYQPLLTSAATVSALWTGCSGSTTYMKSDGTCAAGGGGGSMTWPTGAGIAVYSGSSSWSTSLTVGTGNSNIPQLDSSGNMNIATGKSYNIGGVPVIGAPTDGSKYLNVYNTTTHKSAPSKGDQDCEGSTAACFFYDGSAWQQFLTLSAGGTPTGTWDWRSATVTWPTFNQATSSTAAGLSATLVPASGGTGVANNNSSTITITGAYGVTFTLSGAAGLTIPGAYTYTYQGATGYIPNGNVIFTGPTTTSRNKAVRDAADTILEQGGNYTPSGTWTWGSLTSAGKLTLAASALGGAGFNLAPGAAPTSPVDGDCWIINSGNGLQCRVNGSTVAFASAAGSMVYPTGTGIAYATGGAWGNGGAALAIPLAPIYGGTGVVNTAGTSISFGANVSFPSGFDTQISVTSTTSVTLPTSGTIYSTKSGSITSANLAASLTNETGTNLAVFSDMPTLAGFTTSADAIIGNGLALKTTVTSGNTFTLSGYTGAAYVALLTITNAATPTIALLNPSLGVATGTSFNGITGLSTTTPSMDGSASYGSGTTTARADHIHPSDTTRLALAGGTMSGSIIMGNGLVIQSDTTTAHTFSLSGYGTGSAYFPLITITNNTAAHPKLSLGNAATDFIGFYGAAPIVQPTGDILTALTNLGLIASPTIANVDVGGTPSATGASAQNLTGPREYFECSGACTLTLPTPPSSGTSYEFCAYAGPAVAAAVNMTPPGAVYMQAKAGDPNCTLGHAIASAGAAGDKICVVSIDATHYRLMSSGGTITCQ